MNKEMPHKEFLLLIFYIGVAAIAYFAVGDSLEQKVKGSSDILGLIIVGCMCVLFPNALEYNHEIGRKMLPFIPLPALEARYVRYFGLLAFSIAFFEIMLLVV